MADIHHDAIMITNINNPSLSPLLSLLLPFSLFYPLPFSFTQEIRLPDDIHVDHVASGSAHSVAWSSVKRKAVCKLPEKVPMEFNHLQTVPMLVLRNRLIMLHYFSNMFCKSLTLFGLQSRHSETAPGGHEGVFEGFDRLRSILLSSAKVNLVDKLFFSPTQLRKITLQLRLLIY